MAKINMSNPKGLSLHHSKLQPNIDSWPWQQNTCRVFYAGVLCKYVTRAYCVSTFKYLPANGKYAQWLVREAHSDAGPGPDTDDQPPSWAAPLSRVSASRAQSRAECHPAHIATSRHAQTQTQEIQEKHPQPSGLCPGAGGRCQDPRILRNQEARAEREKKER